jgi:hypothetical protein
MESQSGEINDVLYGNDTHRRLMILMAGSVISVVWKFKLNFQLQILFRFSVVLQHKLEKEKNSIWNFTIWRIQIDQKLFFPC